MTAPMATCATILTPRTMLTVKVAAASTTAVAPSKPACMTSVERLTVSFVMLIKLCLTSWPNSAKRAANPTALATRIAAVEEKCAFGV